MIRFKLYKHEDKLFYFCILGPNNRMILHSGAYKTKVDACAEIEQVWFDIGKAQDHPTVQGCTAERFEAMCPIPYTHDSLKRP